MSDKPIAGNGRMSKARNERMTLEQQIQPLTTKDIRTFFPAMVCPQFAISDICDISPLLTSGDLLIQDRRRHYAPVEICEVEFLVRRMGVFVWQADAEEH